MWDTKRQIIWTATGFIVGTLVLRQDAYNEDGTFNWKFFLFLETLLALIMVVMFLIYSKRH
ncbi:MAG TPA: hypothetical protein VF754_01370 [Pyrinomonadaceae bacterium]